MATNKHSKINLIYEPCMLDYDGTEVILLGEKN